MITPTRSAVWGLRKLGCLSASFKYDMTKIIPVSDDAVQYAVQLLRKGHVVALPTDTVYGLAVDSKNREGIESLFRIKGRDFSKAIAVCVGEIESVKYWGDTSNLPKGLLENLLPGPVTLLLNRRDIVCPSLNPGASRVGIRIPDYSFIRSVANCLGSAIALTSANSSSSPSTLSPAEFRHLWPMLAAVFDGGVLSDNEASRAGSTIVDLSISGVYRIVRPGSALLPTVSSLEKFGLIEH